MTYSMNRLCRIVGLSISFWAPVEADAQSETYEDALNAWSKVLDEFVDDEGRVDFLGLADSQADLDEFVEYVGRVGPASHPESFGTRAEVLAYHINAYNALAMHGVLAKGIPNGFDNFIKRAAFFKFHAVVVAGQKTSLYDYENDVIRPLREERVHFALNCMVRACPRLRREPFRSATLEAQLDAAAREFFSKDRNFRIDADAREVWLSEILEFYTEDFVPDGKRQSLIGYVNRFVSVPVEESYAVRFTPYDWTINRQP
jgi:Protein of unknown function, DUF547